MSAVMEYKTSPERREYLRKWTAKNREHIIEYKANWARNRPPEIKEQIRKKRSIWKKANRERLKKKNDEYREKNREKFYARYKIMYAVRCKKIIPPAECQRCHGKCKTQAHHPDYSKPMEVIWLCAPCHGTFHPRRAHCSVP